MKHNSIINPFLKIFLLIIIVFTFCCCSKSKEDESLLGVEAAFICNVEQGFIFDNERRQTHGYINYLKICDLVLTPDSSVTDPE